MKCSYRGCKGKHDVVYAKGPYGNAKDKNDYCEKHYEKVHGEKAPKGDKE